MPEQDPIAESYFKAIDETSERRCGLEYRTIGAETAKSLPNQVAIEARDDERRKCEIHPDYVSLAEAGKRAFMTQSPKGADMPDWEGMLSRLRNDLEFTSVDSDVFRQAALLNLRSAYIAGRVSMREECAYLARNHKVRPEHNLFSEWYIHAVNIAQAIDKLPDLPAEPEKKVW